MKEWIMANAGTLAVGLALLAVVYRVIYGMVKDRKNGKLACGCDCGSCGGACGCCGKK